MAENKTPDLASLIALLRGHPLFLLSGFIVKMKKPVITWDILPNGQSMPMPVMIMRRMEVGGHALHYHQFTELVLVEGGQGLHVTEDHEYPISAGEIFVIKPNMAHGYINNPDLQICNVLFDLDALQLPLSFIKKLPGFQVLFELEPTRRQRGNFKSRMRVSLEELSRLRVRVDRIERELNEQKEGFEFIVIGELMSLIGQLSRMYVEKSRPASKSLLRLAEVLAHINHNFTAQINLSELQEIAHMSESTLLRHFRESVGKTPIEYMLSLRVEKACELLKNPELSISEVGFACGFQDGNYFSRQFRRITGQSPSQFRELIGGL